MSCIPLGAQKKVTAQHQAEAHSDWSEQQRCVEGGPQDKGSAGHVGLPGAQELGLFKEDFCLGKCVSDNVIEYLVSCMCVYMFLYTCVCACTCVCVRVCVCVCVCACVCVCVCVCAYVRACMYLQAFANKNYPMESIQARWISTLVDFHVDSILDSAVSTSLGICSN